MARLRPGAARRADVRVFSSASDAPRARRPTDAILLLVSVLGIAVLSFPAPGPTALDRAIANLVGDLPGLFGWFWEISYDLLLGWTLVLLVLPLFARGRKRIFVDALIAGVLALAYALVAGRISGTDWSDSLGSLSASEAPAVYLAVRLALTTAVVVMASPYMSRPLRFIGRWVITLGAISGIALGVAYPIGTVAGLLVGMGAGALVHLLLGSPAGRLSLDQIARALDDLNVEATDIRQAPLEPSGVALALASASDGRSLTVKVYGRDAWDGQVLASTWSALWTKGERPSLGKGRLELVEHEAFVTLLAERSGVPVLPVVAAGLATGRDALLVTETTGRPIAALSPDDLDEATLVAAWRSLIQLHDLGVAHGRIDGESVVVRPDGTVALGDFGDAKVSAPPWAMMADRARLLVSTALVVGPDRAVDAALAALGSQALTDVLPFLQPAVVDRDTRRTVKEQEWGLDDLMTRATEATGTEPPELSELRRVTFRSILVVVLIAFVAYIMISAIAGIGWENLVDELTSADAGWLVVALVLSPLSQIPQAFSTIGAAAVDLLYVPSLMLQYGIQFISLAVPSSAGRIALEVRFFQRLGVDAGGAISIGLIDSLSTFVLQLVFILVISLSGLASLDFSSSRSGSSSSGGSSGPMTLIVIAVVLVLLGAIVALAVPRYRAALRAAIPKYRDALRAQLASGASALRVLRSPSKLLMLFGGNFFAQIMLAIILGICLRAYGYSASLAGLILVNTLVSLFAGFMPVPGGMGVAEAGYTAALVALGIPETAAVSTAITFRLVTYYLPPIWGAFAMRWMRHHEYL